MNPKAVKKIERALRQIELTMTGELHALVDAGRIVDAGNFMSAIDWARFQLGELVKDGSDDGE